jgi:glycosyltransferase involved in cell wall biosynthesis
LFLDDPSVALCFTVQCSLDGFYRLDLLLATCRRVNPCQLRLLVRAVAQGQVGPVLRQVWFSGLTVCDNQFHAIQFEPLEESAGKTYQIELDSPDATPDTGIAAWCHTRQPQVLSLQRLSEAEPLQNPGLLPLWAQQGLSALPLSAQLQAWRPNQAQATAPRYCLLIHGIDLDTSPLHLHLFLSRFGQLLAAQGLTASFCLAGVANSALRDYMQGQQWTLEPDTALPALLRLGLSSGAAWLWSCQVRALPADDLLSRAEALFADPELAVLVPMETAPGDTIRAAYAQVVRDGGLKNLAAGQPVEHPWFGYRRKVEATHSSLLMLRSSALQNLDWAAIAAYATPVYQLTDLIWQCKMQQYTAVYQGALRWQHSLPAVWAYTEQDAADGLRFNQRWRAQLPADLPPLARARDLLNPDQRPSVLVIDATLPTFDEDSGSLRLYTLLKIWAALGYHLSFIPDNKDSQPRYRRALEDLGIEVFYNGYNVQHALSQRRYDYAFICRVDVGHRYMPLIRLLSPETWIFYDTVDIHYVRELRQAEIENKPDIARRAQLTKRKELHNCRLADEVITVTDDDGRHLQQELPYLHYQVLPNIHRQMPPPAPYAERDGLVFIGNYNHPPNEDAVLFFVEAVLPKIRQRLPDLRLYLVGSHMKERLKALASEAIEVVGWIDEVEPFFAQRRVFVSYLRYGAGMKGKLGQAMAAGLPVVSTTMGAEGMGMVDGETALIADDPDSFADAVCRLYSDAALWEKLVTQGQAYIEQTYGETAARQKLTALLASWPRPAPPV